MAPRRLSPGPPSPTPLPAGAAPTRPGRRDFLRYRRYPAQTAGGLIIVLTENEVQRSFAKLLHREDLDSNAFDLAEELIDQLRPESPLRQRLLNELEEIRKIRA